MFLHYDYTMTIYAHTYFFFACIFYFYVFIIVIIYFVQHIELNLSYLTFYSLQFTAARLVETDINVKKWQIYIDLSLSVIRL